MLEEIDEEAFILLQGEAVMVTAGTQDQPGRYEAIRFVGGRIYVVRHMCCSSGERVIQ